MEKIKGAKYDDNKPRPSTVPVEAILRSWKRACTALRKTGRTKKKEKTAEIRNKLLRYRRKRTPPDVGGVILSRKDSLQKRALLFVKRSNRGYFAVSSIRHIVAPHPGGCLIDTLAVSRELLQAGHI